MDYILLTLSIVFSVLAASLFRVFSNSNKNGVSVFLYNAVSTAVWFFVLFPTMLSNPDRSVTTHSVIYGIFYGLMLFLYLYYKCRAMATGPVALTTLIGSSCFIVATLFGVIYCREGITVFQIIGIILMLISIFLCLNLKLGGEKVSKKWFLNCLGFFLSNSTIGIIYKLFGSVSNGNDYDCMLITAAITAIVLYAVCDIFKNRAEGKKFTYPGNKLVGLMLLTGFSTCVYIRLNLYLSNALPSVVFFPVANAAIIILSTIIGFACFKEKLKLIQIGGIILGIVAIIFSSCIHLLF